MAARLGLEPRQNESESFVLPLHHRAGENFFGKGASGEATVGREPARQRQGQAGRPLRRQVPPGREDAVGLGRRADPQLGARRLEPAMGFEPATACLQNRCSTIELRRRKRIAALAENLTDTVKKRENGILACHAKPARAKHGGSPGTRTPNLLIKSQLLYH